MIFNEVYDAVDKDGNKIGTATWIEHHSKGLLHQCVHGLVFKNYSRKQILIKRRHTEMAQGPSLWEVAVTGHILAGRTPEREIRKELQEELFEGHRLPKNIKIKKISHFLIMIFLTIMKSPIYMRLFIPDHFIIKKRRCWKCQYGLVSIS